MLFIVRLYRWVACSRPADNSRNFFRTHTQQPGWHLDIIAERERLFPQQIGANGIGCGSLIMCHVGKKTSREHIEIRTRWMINKSDTHVRCCSERWVCLNFIVEEEKYEDDGFGSMSHRSLKRSNTAEKSINRISLPKFMVEILRRTQ